MGKGKPFDACKVHMSETGDCPDWHTVSLVYAVRALLTHEPGPSAVQPTSERGAHFVAIVGELTRRGIDGNALVRYGFMPRIVGTLISMITASRILPAESEFFSVVGVDLDAWMAVLGVPTGHIEFSGESEDDLREFTEENAGAFLPQLLSWATTASLEDLATLTPPAEAPSLDSVPMTSDLDLISKYYWIVDRFSTTFLREWATESLHFEYKWLQGYEAAPCSEVLMGDRLVDQADLNAEIARRVITPGADLRVSIEPQLLQVYKMSEHAGMLLKKGRYREAATLLEFARSQQPSDPMILNNLGFALILENAREALFYLEAAAKARYSEPAINIYNQMCCLVILGQARRALRIAGEYWADQQGRSPVPATLWGLSASGDWNLTGTKDARVEIVALAQEIARREGLEDTVERWRHRGSELGTV